MGSLNVAKLFKPTLILAKFVFWQLTVIPTSDSVSHLQGYKSRDCLGHLYCGPGGIYSALAVSNINTTKVAKNKINIPLIFTFALIPAIKLEFRNLYLEIVL